MENSPVATAASVAPRRIVARTQGHKHSFVTRLMSPGDIGELLKPYVFLDLFEMTGAPLGNMGLHPHSGIATLTWVTRGNVDYEDTSGQSGVLPRGGVEWMVAGGGIWHGGGWSGGERTCGFQLWVALPPSLELGEAVSTYLAPDLIPQVGPVQVLLGEYGGARSLIDAPSPMNYLAVALKAGERWRYQPAAGHTVAWVALSEGRLHVPEGLAAGELAVFDGSEGALDFHADTDTEFVLGTAVPHPHPLTLGSYSVHTNSDALLAGERNIAGIGRDLRVQGRLR